MSNKTDRAVGLASYASHADYSASLSINIDGNSVLTLNNTIIKESFRIDKELTSKSIVSIVDTGAYITVGNYIVGYAHTIKSTNDDFIYDVGFRTAIERALASISDTRFIGKNFKQSVWNAYNDAVGSTKVYG